jgi:hypothetical protein
MAFLKTGAARWVVPAALAAVLAAALLVTPVIGASNGVTAKKMNKTIAKKTNVTQLSIAGAPNLSTAQTVLGTLSLGQGSYDVTSTFDVRQNAVGANIQCVLRLNGVGQDQSDTFVHGNDLDQSSVARCGRPSGRHDRAAALLVDPGGEYQSPDHGQGSA